jgi:rod shape-determining protein MreC
MQNLIAFIKKLRIFFVFTTLQVIAFWLYVSYMSVPKSNFFTTASYISGALFEVEHTITKHFNLEENNLNLQKENILLRKKIPSFLYNENPDSLFKKDVSYRQQFSYIPATIINSTTTKRNNFFTLNVGQAQGLKRGMGVFSSNGIVGIIHNSSHHFSLVKSVLTSDINIDVLIEGVGAFGLLKWDGKDPRFATIYGITNDISVPVGSNAITRGGGGIFPKGISVGKVKSVKSIEGKPVWRIQIELSEKYGSLENVYVLRNLFIEEFSSLQNEIQAQ